ncbi:MAG TPA: enoyl-CoA hydratase/isomerase family protein [Sphingobacterium sp.]|nr:enoyl-CoA hydratase/isomerase family protein [Sphingobacterium sp.]
MLYNDIRVQKEDFRFVLTLARPDKRNAFTPTMVNEIDHAFQDANADSTIKIVVIKAEGPVFCAGMDLKAFENPDTGNKNPNMENRDISLGEVFDKLLKPSVAIIEGDVIAGAFLIVLGCTYAFCKKTVRFRLPELVLGIFPFQVMASLLKVMPRKKVLQLCLDTDYFVADKALAYGIVDGFLEDDSYDRIISGFADIRVEALSAGLEALATLPEVTEGKRFAYLKACLERLQSMS